jgi:uncharacterized protein YbbC (DUF1343 family)
VGELAGLFKQELHERKQLEVKLTVIPMHGYRRAMRFEQAGLDWVPPSPNLRTLSAALLYPGTAWVEGSNVSVGRGTDHPFAWIGAPWIDGQRLADVLNQQALPGVRINAVDFVPTAATYQGQTCHGIEIRIAQRDALDAPALGLALVQALQKLWPETFKLDRARDMIGSQQTLQDVRDGKPAPEIIARWQKDLLLFEARRKDHLLYGP